MSAPKPLVETRLFINGEYADASDRKTFKLYNPATHDLVAEVAEASADDTNRAVAAAKAAQPAWAELAPHQRGAHMKKLAALIRDNMQELAVLEAMSMGKPVGTYIDGVLAAGRLDTFAEAGGLVQGKTSLNTPGTVGFTWKQPFGVVAGIIPWNVPLYFCINKAAPALVVGNVVVIKSSEKAPLTSARIGHWIKEAGFPPGVFNIISGYGNPSGVTLASHMDVRAISFTGSGRTGRAITVAAAQSNLKNVTLELGGKSPAIIFEDADLEQAAAETQYSIQWNSGQVCMANSRIYVQDTVADKYIATFKKMFGAAKAGDPTDPGINHGPVADEVQYHNVHRYIDMAKAAGGELLLGGEKAEKGKGFFVKPTIFTNTPEDHQFMKEEIFGPVVNISVFSSEDEVLKKANDTEYGLYSSVYTKNIDRAMRVAKHLEAGTVGVNCTSPTTCHDLPFGGYKASGTGREGVRESLDHFCEVKTVVVKVGK
ncbi:aldehyde dehydrogenase domain-containing protein [Lineolata rhizophorae]|uniref:aldehyde dehydrogenase (NAD(+)) n=1 Tax=Lineolata rhizophorae TaxID=578093 RepID=A0A6A6NVI3_9PEZI|nr:aldehyde dehydrogenase domain-containing protein [Lineolata rhizophorae]